MDMLGNLHSSIYPKSFDRSLTDRHRRILSILTKPGDVRSLRFESEDLRVATELHFAGMMNDPELITIGLFLAVQRKNENLWFGGVNKDFRPDAPLVTQARHIRLRGVKSNALEALSRWQNGSIIARACCGEVSVSELVCAQAQGFRYVGLSNDADFIAHDLCHLFRYFYPKVSAKDIDDYHVLQRGFFVLVHHLLPAFMAKGWTSENSYDEKLLLNHVITDMNGDGCFLHSALLAQVINFIRHENPDVTDCLPDALTLIWRDVLNSAQLINLLDVDLDLRYSMVNAHLKALALQGSLSVAENFTHLHSSDTI